MARHPVQKRHKVLPKRKPTPYDRVQSPLDDLKDVIHRLYIVEDKNLKDVIAFIQTNHGVVQSEKQYKTRLTAWRFVKHLNIQDAAFILRLLNQAQAEGLPEVVLWSPYCRRKTRADIERYIRRNSKLNDEHHLLSHISDDDETPHDIQLAEPSTEQGHSHTPQILLTTPLGGPSGHLAPPAGLAAVPSMRHPTPSPESSPQISPERRNLPHHGPTPSASSSEFGTVDMDLELPDNFMDVPARGAEGQPALIDVLAPFVDSIPEFDPGTSDNFQHIDDSSFSWTGEFTFATLSSTPAAIGQQGRLVFDASRSGDHIHTSQLNDGSHSAAFVNSCLYWLIYIGQDDAGCRESADYHMGSAKFCFLSMMKRNNDAGAACLGALSVVTVLFECLGHREKLLQLLSECDSVTQTHLGAENPLAMTISFKKNMLQFTEGENPTHNVNQLSHVYHQLQHAYPHNTGPALSARYNLDWALLENALNNTDRSPRHFYHVRQDLEELARECEAHFGPTRIETIMAYATLARASLYSDDAEKAEEIIVDFVFPRIRQNFPENHPYTWEAKHRHAYLLLQLARRDPGLTAKRKLQQAEQLLREIVLSRRRVLGESNPKTRHSFQMLKTVLEKQGKVNDANSLWKWCQHQM